VVYAKHLALGEHRAKGGVELLGRGEIAAEGFLDDDLRLVGLAEIFRGQAAGAEVDQDGLENGGGRGNVKKRLNLAAEFFFDPGDVDGEPVEGRPVVVAAGDVGGACGDARPYLGVELAP
jgi:hypothetical protein